jgi:hypothetical protein
MYKRCMGSTYEVWVEQEIAIASFLRQAQNRNLQVAVYIQHGLKREGVRDQLQLNPVEFNTMDEVIADFRVRLLDGRFKPVRLPPPKEVDLELVFTRVSCGNGDVHRYRLSLRVTNTGAERLTDYWVGLHFRNAAIASDAHYPTKIRETATHALFRLDRQMAGVDLYPNDWVDLFAIDYYMDNDLDENGSVLKQLVIGEFGSPGMATKSIKKPFRELQDF